MRQGGHDDSRVNADFGRELDATIIPESLLKPSKGSGQPRLNLVILMSGVASEESIFVVENH